MHLPIIEDPDFARIVQLAQEGELADPTDRLRMRSFVISIMSTYAAVWLSYRSGHLSEDSYEELVADTRILCGPGMLPFVKEDLEIRNKVFVRELLPALAEDADTPFQPPLKS